MAEADVQPAQVMLRTVVVDGPLALKMRRLKAARAGDVGLAIETLPPFAAHLAGGFARPASSADLELAVQDALADGGFAEITPLVALPGMVRAVLRSLDRLWRAGIAAEAHAGHHPRLADLALLETRIRARLSGGALIAPDLVRGALQRRALFARIAGDVTFEQIHGLTPVWRPLVEALAEEVRIEWRDCLPPPDWTVAAAPSSEPPASTATVEIVSCANPQAEVIEALRWARALVASGTAQPAEIAILATAPEGWDDSMLGLSASAGLPVHFSHGIPALCSFEGQACAALADLLSQGLSYGRLDRLLRHGRGRAPALAELPGQPLAGVPAGAALTTIEQWRRALRLAGVARGDGFDIAGALEPVLALVPQGLEAAAEAGPRLLPQRAAALWQVALRRAPAAALPFTLSGLRIADDRDPGANIAWGPAAHFSGAPRPWMRLIGLTSRSWPRPRRDDPLLPDHILPIDPALSPSRPDEDRSRFVAIARGASAGLSLSYARRAPLGGAQAPSPLLPRDVPCRRLPRLRIPEHAFSEGDRLQARPKDGKEQPRLARPAAFARARHKGELTPWDGLVRADHPVIVETLAGVQSSSSLRQLLRDPQGYVWRYALGWHATLEEAQTLSLDDRAFGDVVHRLLQYAVARLEQSPGFAQAAEHEVEEALTAASADLFVEWPTQRPTPPPMLWRHMLDKAAQLALTALRLDAFKPGTRSWTEVAFGDPQSSASLPWDTQADVLIPGTRLTIRGRIDRVEVAAGDRAVRITDYKTGAAPNGSETIILAAGAELQRVLYGIVAQRHLPDAVVHADLVYLGDAAPRRFGISELDVAMARVAEMLNATADAVRRGLSLPGPDAGARWNPYRLARAAPGEPLVKTAAIATALRDIAWVWNER